MISNWKWIMYLLSILLLSGCMENGNRNCLKTIEDEDIDSSGLEWIYEDIENEQIAIVFLDIDYYGVIPVYDNPKGKLIKEIRNDSTSSDFIGFELLYKGDDMFNVVAFSCLTGQIMAKGWIDNNSHLGIYSSMYQGNMVIYEQPDSSKIMCILKDYYPGKYDIIDFSGSWLKITANSKGKFIEGWIPRNEQCWNVYSTCS